MANPILHPKPDAPCLALRLREAARAIGVSDRTLWEWTRQGDVPHVRRGGTILYPTAALTRWLEAQMKTSTVATEGGAE